MYKIIFYESNRGECYTEEFLGSLSIRVQGKINKWFQRLREYGPALPRPFSDKVRGKIRELRVSFGSNEYRFLYTFFGKVILVTHGFIKKTDKIPKTEILQAKHIIEDFKRRNRL